MGRKIPGKKHRGVKDPEKQRAKRLAELETKINAPPKDVQEQAIPKSLENLIKLKEAVKSGRISKVKKVKKRKKNGLICVGGEKSKSLHPKSQPEKAVPIFQQKPDESNNRFFYRVSQETHAFLNETAFERKYNVIVNRNSDTGEVEGLSKRPKNELDELERLRAKHKNIRKKKKNKEGEGDMNLTKSQKRRQKLLIKKKKKEEDLIDNFKTFQDEVKFGETVHAPPELVTRPKKANLTDNIKPGKKNLLLHSLFTKNGSSSSNSTKSVTIDRTGKRKNLPTSERRQLEKEQSSVIAAYRQLKARQSADVHT
uniref:coiled-coil domain-containing protein 137 n=1 Tax=Vespula vulgaris TaxID=7454 RepID=UPI00213DAB41|nr:coiled-coil domain-containing protein 137 [Vespula vulgaris]XP_050856860.1 coiled-coil domain-containing protein 137 [Vespula vulgaris]